MAGREGAVETGGGLGEFNWRQLEKVSGGADKLGGDVASVVVLWRREARRERFGRAPVGRG